MTVSDTEGEIMEKMRAELRGLESRGYGAKGIVLLREPYHEKVILKANYKLSKPKELIERDDSPNGYVTSANIDLETKAISLPCSRGKEFAEFFTSMPAILHYERLLGNQIETQQKYIPTPMEKARYFNNELLRNLRQANPHPLRVTANQLDYGRAVFSLEASYPEGTWSLTNLTIEPGHKASVKGYYHHHESDDPECATFDKLKFENGLHEHLWFIYNVLSFVDINNYYPSEGFLKEE